MISGKSLELIDSSSASMSSENSSSTRIAKRITYWQNMSYHSVIRGRSRNGCIDESNAMSAYTNLAVAQFHHFARAKDPYPSLVWRSITPPGNTSPWRHSIAKIPEILVS